MIIPSLIRRRRDGVVSRETKALLLAEGANSWSKVDAACAIRHSAKSSTGDWDGHKDESDNTPSNIRTPLSLSTHG